MHTHNVHINVYICLHVHICMYMYVLYHASKTVSENFDSLRYFTKNFSCSISVKFIHTEMQIEIKLTAN